METGENNSLIKFTEALLSLNKPVLFVETGSDFLYLLALEKNTSKQAFCALQQTNAPDEMAKIASDKAIKNNIGKLFVSTCNLKHTLIPTAIFEKQLASDYLKLNCEITSNDIIQYKIIDVFDTVSVYAFEQNISQLATQLYPGAEIVSSAYLFASHGINNAADSFNLYIYDHLLMIRYIKNNKIHFFNSFTYNSITDAIYYILYCFDQLSLNNETQNVEIAGNLNTLTQIVPEIKKYINNISYSEKPEHQYLNLYNIEKCV
jgi:hypothetical protein